MPAVQSQHLIHFDISEAEIDQAIADCGGDPRAVIRTLMLAQATLEGELSRARAQSSLGYTRGRAQERTS